MVFGATVEVDTSESVTVDVPMSPKTADPMMESASPIPVPAEETAPAAVTAENAPSSDLECDFDQNPTDLYLRIQEKKWDEANARAVSDPLEAATWVSRKERSGKLRWRLLPLHAAIIFKAPVQTIQALIRANVKATECKDDQGMLPIHLAFRNGSEINVVHMLLVAYPEGIKVQDRKGRVPLVVAQASNSPFKAQYVSAIQYSPFLHEIATSLVKTVEKVASPDDGDDYAKTKESLEKEMDELKKAHEEEKAELNDRNASLEADLAKNQETSQVLVDHVTSLEAQLSSRSDTERFLATKIENLDNALKDTSRNKELVEAQIMAEKMTVDEENSSLKVKVSELEKKLSSLQTNYDKTDEAFKKLLNSRDSSKIKASKEVQKMEAERAAVIANAAVLEAQLKKKMEQEHLMAKQLSSLASQIAESATVSSSERESLLKRIDTLAIEKQALEAQLQLLTKKLEQVVKALNCMSQEQERIVAQAAEFEDTMEMVTVEQSQLMGDAARQEQILIDSVREREQIVSILTRQAVEIEQTTAERIRIMEAVTQQTNNVAKVQKERVLLVDNVNKQKSVMADLVSDIRDMGIMEAASTFEEYDSDDDDNVDSDEENEVETEAVEAVEVTFEDITPVKAEVDLMAPTTKKSEEEEESFDIIKQEEVDCRFIDGRTPDEILNSALKLSEEENI